MPVYDGVGMPDEPYRYAVPPVGSGAVQPPTTATATTPVQGGRSTAGLSVTSAESGPQVSVFLPLGALAAPGGTITVQALPQAPADPLPGYRFDGNRYRITATDPAGPVALTPQAAFATVQLRATTAEEPGPVVLARATPDAPWTALETSRGGFDVYGAPLRALGDYQLAVRTTEAQGGSRVLPAALGGGVLLLAAAVLVVRRRSSAR